MLGRRPLRNKISVFLIIFYFASVGFISFTGNVSAQSGTSEGDFDPVIKITHSIFDKVGNIIITGETQNFDAYVAKISPDGKIIWQDHFGGFNSSAVTRESIEGVAVDDFNNVIILGQTGSTQFPVKDAAYGENQGGIDLFIRKISFNGNVIWSTYFGGEGKEWGAFLDRALFVDDQNDIIISGFTTSSQDFPITNNAFQKDWRGGQYFYENGRPPSNDPFVAKISSDGQLVWSSYIGGATGDYIFTQIDSNYDIIVGGGSGIENPGDPVWPTTQGALQPDVAGAFDGVIAKIGNEGDLMWSTFSGGSQEEFLGGDPILVDSNDNVYHVILTRSSDHIVGEYEFAHQPDYGGGQDDIAITKLSSTGELIWSSYLGGDGRENETPCCLNELNDHLLGQQPIRKILDTQDSLILVGRTRSTNFPVSNALQSSPQGSALSLYVTKFENNGDLGFSTYLGGSQPANLGTVHVDHNDNILITGSTLATDFPTSSDSFQPDHAGGVGHDLFITKYSSDNLPLWSTYLGGTGDERISNAKMDNIGNLFVIGQTSSSDLPELEPGSTNMGEFDVFITKISPEGLVEWSNIYGGSKRESFNLNSILLSEEGKSYLIGTTRSSDMDLPVTYDGIEYGFLKSLDENGEEQWDYTLVGGESVPPDPPRLEILYVLVGIILSGGLLIGFLNYRRSSNVLINQKIAAVISPIFNSKPSLVYLLIGQSMIKDKDLESGLRSEIPKEMFNFKSIFHPIRLAIVQLLYENTMMTTVEIRDDLDITWNEVTNHLNALKKQGYISIEQQFIEGITRITATPEPKLLSHYQELRGLLLDFLQKSPDFDRYLEQVISLKETNTGEDLYPSTN